MYKEVGLITKKCSHKDLKMPDNDNQEPKIKSRTHPIINKMNEMMDLIEEIDRLIQDDCEPYEISPTVKALDKIVNEIRIHIKTEFKRELSLKSTRTLPKWITKNKSIMDAIGKTRFEDVWVYIQKHTIPHQSSRFLAQKKRWGKHEEKREYVLFYPDYLDMQNSLNLSPSSIQKYFKAFCDIGIMKKLGKSGSKGTNVYAVGFWSVYGKEGEGGGTRRNYYLKNTKEISDALKKFKVRN